MKIEDIYPSQIVSINNSRCWEFYCGKPLTVISIFDLGTTHGITLRAEDGTIMHQHIKFLEPYKTHIIKE